MTRTGTPAPVPAPVSAGHCRKNAARAAAAGALTAAFLGLAPLAHAAQPVPPAPAAPSGAGVAEAHEAATAPTTLDTLSRFFARDGAIAKAKARPVIDGATVPVYTLAPEFVAGRTGVPVATLDFLASKAVSADGQKASVWTARAGDAWKVVNIATGDDETRYAAEGARRLGGGTVFREPQIDAWYVQRGDRVLPLDEDATRAIGAGGTSLARYQARVHKEYGDKLPGSAYEKKGLAGGYGKDAAPAAEGRAPAADTAATAAARTDGDGPLDPGTAAAATGGVLALGATALVIRRRRRG
ncbi:hypothetical protein SMD11_5085 [Streptomyces albireticuli]|uniref:Gram-positive cocci surface proteins LPxTG domain-containing protein n=1 Tax=Streptomyces albireticuli TaxID=1940 RepID=A0A1Z2L8R0_9ACTN|nr:hypothetical protein [Streptomyces albireticuli]ARZ70677.1 hypothetical protein SMD11_5085 [Streptomyces albireticuli]